MTEINISPQFNHKRGPKLNETEVKLWVLGNEHTKQYFREYYHNKNKERVTQKLICDVCDKEYTLHHKKRHQDSKYHTKRLATQQPNNS
jgi:hypothetical protein